MACLPYLTTESARSLVRIADVAGSRVMDERPSDVSEAAGGVVWRRTETDVELLLVYRQQFDDWSLPKGGVEGRESPRQAALREVVEETGVSCAVGEALPTLEWTRADGSLRRCHWWLMRPVQVGARRPGDTVTRCEWFSVEEALRVPTYERERETCEDGS